MPDRVDMPVALKAFARRYANWILLVLIADVLAWIVIDPSRADRADALNAEERLEHRPSYSTVVRSCEF